MTMRDVPVAELEAEADEKLGPALASGTKAAHRSSGGEPSRRALVDELRRLALELRDTPRRIDLRNRSDYRLSHYVSEFGSWEAALVEALNEPEQSGRL